MEPCGWSEADHTVLTVGDSFIKLRSVFSSDPPVSMAILITSPGLVTTGTEGADDIRFITGGSLTANGSVVNGLDGNDTITTNASGVLTRSGAAIGAGVSIDAGSGSDIVTLFVDGSTTSAENAIVLGGVGDDTITVGAASGVGSFSNVDGGEGADSITISTGIYSAIAGGAGNDTINLTGTVNLQTADSISLGAGDDVISGSVTLQTAAGILGGDGADTITLAAIANSGSFVNGDDTVNGGAADVISVTTQGVATIVRGKGGADTIGISNLGVSAVVAGNAGGDMITVSGIADDAAIKAGQGGDMLKLDVATLAGISAEMIGGGGKDTITIEDTVVNNSTITMNGGAGVDSITFSGAIGAGVNLGVLGISNMGDSKVGAMDTVDITGLAAGNALMTFAVTTPISLGSAATLGDMGDLAVTGATGFTTAVGQSGSVVEGAMSFSGQASATVATAAINADAVTRVASGTSQGRAVMFTAGSDEYLFVQGGAAGTDDDYVVKFNGTDGTTITGTTIILGGD